MNRIFKALANTGKMLQQLVLPQRSHPRAATCEGPATIVPEAMPALLALGKSAEKCGIPKRTLDFIHLRARSINGCSVCLDMHARIAKRRGESDERLFTVAAWREAPYFTGAEPAALALTETITRLSDRTDPRSRRDPGRSSAALRRANAGRSHSFDSRHQRVESAQRCDTTGGG